MSETDPQEEIGFEQSSLDNYIDSNVLSFEEMVDEWAKQEYPSAAKDRGRMLVRRAGGEEQELTYETMLHGTLDVAKTDGGTPDLEYGLMKFREGVVVNMVERDSARLWKKLSDGICGWYGLIVSKDPSIVHIPVSPVYKLRENSESKARVLTRYSGLSIRYLNYLLEKVEIDEASAEVESFIPSEFMRRVKAARSEMNGKMDEIKSQLRRFGIDMGHSHSGNFTVEFVKEEYYDRMLEGDGECNINNLPYEEENVTFSLRDYLKGGYKMIVRAIDLDEVAPSRFWIHDEIRHEFDLGSLEKYSSNIISLLGETSEYRQLVGLIAANWRMCEEVGLNDFQNQVMRRLPALLSDKNTSTVRKEAANRLIEIPVWSDEVWKLIPSLKQDKNQTVRNLIRAGAKERASETS